MMKKSIAYLLLLCFVMFSCSDSNDESKEYIKLSTNKVYIWEDEGGTVEIKTALNNPSIRIEDTSIAKAEIKDNIINITTFKTGYTYIYISDHQHHETSFLVSVGSMLGVWNEWTNGIYVNKADVIADNQEEANALKNILLEDLKNNIGAPYNFSDKNDTFSITRLDSEKNAKNYNGKYVYDSNNSVLTLTYNDIEEIYQVYPLNYYLVKLELDLTEAYKTKYPVYGISKVLVTKYLLKPRNL